MLFYFSLLRLIIEFQFKELNYEENQLSFRLQSKKSLNDRGTALVQVEAYLNKKKVYFSTHVYLRPEQWDVKERLLKSILIKMH